MRIIKPPGLFAGKADNDNIRPAVMIDIVRKCEEVFGILRDVKWHSFVVFVPLGELRAGVPIWTGDDVHYAVVIEVAEVGALAEKLIGELSLLERMQRVLLGAAHRGTQTSHQAKTTENILTRLHSDIA